MTEMTNLEKGFNDTEMVQRLSKIDDISYWRSLNPDSTISDFPFEGLKDEPKIKQEDLDRYLTQLQEEGYFQTEPLVPESTIQEMLRCIESVKQAGFPPIFALVYDVFYNVFKHFDSVLSGILQPGYKMIPNFWFFYVNPCEDSKGFEPHRDREYGNTIDASSGLPTVVTVWIPITAADPLNSCLYMLPTNRDPHYAEATRNLEINVTPFAFRRCAGNSSQSRYPFLLGSVHFALGES